MEGNRRMLLVVGTIVVIVLLIFGGYLAVGGHKPTHQLTIKSVPSDLKLTLDGTEIQPNGTIEVKEGKHTLTGERRGFETYTQQLDIQTDKSVKVYLFAKDDEGREWERANPNEALQREEEVGRAHDEQIARLQAKYPLMGQLPFSGNGFTMYYDKSRAHPDDPEQLGFYVQLRVPEADAKPEVENWIRTTGADPAQLELIYLPPKK